MESIILAAFESLKNHALVDLKSFIKQNFNDKDVVIYGAGGFGKEIAGVLLRHNIKPKAFLDIKAQGQLFDIPIEHPEKFSDKNAIVVLSIVLNKKTRNEIINYLNQLGFKNIIDAQKIRAMYVELQSEHTYQNLKSTEAEILKPLEFLADDESKITYAKNVAAHISKNYKDAAETDEIEQYFVKNIPFKKNFKKFIDCGAYIGDTFLKLLELNPEAQEYIGFEPMPETFEKLVQTTSSKNIKSVTIPAAVSDKTGFINFSSMLGSSSFDTSGDVTVACIKLDDILHNYDAYFLKMDIEGEEINALNGAKMLIKNAKPEMAICVYHYINHFWEIPNLLYNWNRELSLGYKFYLRTHSSACMETVLYAVKENG